MRKRSLKSVLAAGVTATLVGAAASIAAVGTAHAAPTNTTGAAASSGGSKVAYFDQWSIYQNAFYVKNLDTEGIAGNLNYLLYDFENRRYKIVG